MNIQDFMVYFEENIVDDEDLQAFGVRNIDTRKRKQGGENRVVTTGQDDVVADNASVLEAIETGFELTYLPSRHEAGWLFNALAPFFLDQWFDDILRIIRGGKEASVYLCKAHETVGVEYLAAKVYRPRQFRNLRKDHTYREGRDYLDGQGHVILDGGQLHAIRQKTTYGQQLMHSSWIDYEVKAMKQLREAGCDVPRLYANGEMALLMEYFGDETGGAPTLHEVELDATEAKPLFERMVHNIDLMLAQGIIHGDLSAYNVLYWEGEITMIDFPQIVMAETNPNAYVIFQRDVRRICEYFNRYGIGCDGASLAEKLWRAHGRRVTSDVPLFLLHQEGDEDEDE